MGNIILNFKRLIINKNTVTIFGVILCLAIIVVSYNKRVNSSLDPIKVPYAKEQIASGVQITSKMVGITEIPRKMLEDGQNVLTNPAEVIDKYSNADTIIPQGSLFYTRTVVEKEELPANIILDYPEGYVLYNMEVDTESTYGNSVYPDTYIDIYLKIVTNQIEGIENTTGDNKVMIGKLLSHIKVLAVKDSNGYAVFENESVKRTPAMIIFAIPEEYFILLSKASFLRTYSSTLIPVPTNESLKEEVDEVDVSSETLKEWINEKTVWLDK